MHHEILLLALPIAVSFLVPLLGRRLAVVSRWIAFLGYLGGLAYALVLFPSVLGSARVIIVAGWLPPLGIALFLSPLSLGAVTLVYLIAALAALYNLGSPAGDRKQGEGSVPEGDRSARGVGLQALFVLGAGG
jgi:formate hydrogenlyase subunit 3/multisubunit Na+/H+ antiporter MnhD subunit